MPKYYVKMPNNNYTINAENSYEAITKICNNFKLSVSVGDKIVINETGFLWENDHCTIYKILKAINE